MGFNGEAGSSSQALPREDSPLLPQESNLSSPPKTFANVFIAIVGAGVLGLPYTFKKTGWLLGVIMLLFVAFLTYHCMMLLIYTRRKLESRKESLRINSFGDLGFAVCGSIGRFAVDSMIVLSQAGFCVGYLIFIANTLVFLFNSSSSSSSSVSVYYQSQRILGIKPKTLYIWSCFPFQLGLNSIPTLTHLAPLSIFADFMGMALPLESETEDKGRFGKVLGLSMGFISFIYAAFGVLGYFAFGAETKDIITTNFGKGLVSYVVQLALCINLFFTFPLMMNPVYEVFERRFSDGRYSLWLRWILVLGVSVVALMVPNFADFMSLVGSSVCSVLGFVLPALFHLMAFKDEIERKAKFLDVAIMFFGLVLGVSGTWSSILQKSPATD
ncbi:hypothetical protein AQUCO_01500326v1 [Aquilegia coerulea]|uniref:Amino acid transporter transmembrane domain-containing protein n=1 Tax=Aquilegia coerulea TaxID=218851 RepID=A0A2G5DTY3_AQUCA|nr:hypothetical protein AQUCO_01500326v1 [Aquilegia coerulea]